MSSEPRSLAQDAQDRLVEAVALQLRMLDGIRSRASGQVQRPSALDDAASARSHLESLLYDAARVSASANDGWLQLVSKHFDVLADLAALPSRMATGGAAYPGGGPAAQRPARPASPLIKLRGYPGEECWAATRIQNTESRAMEVRIGPLELTERGEPGGRIARAADPIRVPCCWHLGDREGPEIRTGGIIALEPGEEEVLCIRVPLDKPLEHRAAASGQESRWVGSARLFAHGRVMGEIRVVIAIRGCASKHEK